CPGRDRSRRRKEFPPWLYGQRGDFLSAGRGSGASVTGLPRMPWFLFPATIVVSGNWTPETNKEGACRLNKLDPKAKKSRHHPDCNISISRLARGRWLRLAKPSACITAAGWRMGKSSTVPSTEVNPSPFRWEPVA